MITPEELNDKIEKSLEYQEECQLNDIMGRLNGRVTRHDLQDSGNLNPTIVYDKFIKVDFLLFPSVIKELQDAGFTVEKIDDTKDFSYLKVPASEADKAVNILLGNEEGTVSEVYKVTSIKSPEYEYKISWK